MPDERRLLCYVISLTRMCLLIKQSLFSEGDVVIAWAAPSLFCCRSSLMAFPWSFCVKTNVRTWLSCVTPADTGISWISDSRSQHGVQAADSRHTYSPGHLHFQSHPGHHRSAANLMFCLGFFFSCPLRACLNSWRWWMRVKNTLQVGFGYNLSWEGGEDEGIRGGIEGGMVYRWAWGVGEVGARMFVFQWAVTLRERGGESGMRGERRVTGGEGRESISMQRRFHVLTESLRINCWLTYSVKSAAVNILHVCIFW